jgi:hypothetical protein
LTNENRVGSGLAAVRIIAWIFLVGIPALYLVIVLALPDHSFDPTEAHLLAFYILLVVGIALPAVYLAVERYHFIGYRKEEEAKLSPDRLYITLGLVKMSLVDAVYLFGLFMYLLSSDLVKMLCFYAVGIAWSIAYWPRARKYERFLSKLGELS